MTILDLIQPYSRAAPRYLPTLLALAMTIAMAIAMAVVGAFGSYVAMSSRFASFISPPPR